MIGVEEIAPKSVRSGRLLVRDRGGFVWLGDDVGVVAGIKKRSLSRGSGRAGRGTSWKRESGTPDRSRTYDTQLRKLVLYPLSYGRIQGHYSVKVGKCKGRGVAGCGGGGKSV